MLDLRTMTENLRKQGCTRVKAFELLCVICKEYPPMDIITIIESVYGAKQPKPRGRIVCPICNKNMTNKEHCQDCTRLLGSDVDTLKRALALKGES